MYCILSTDNIQNFFNAKDKMSYVQELPYFNLKSDITKSNYIDTLYLQLYIYWQYNPDPLYISLCTDSFVRKNAKEFSAYKYFTNNRNNQNNQNNQNNRIDCNGAINRHKPIQIENRICKNFKYIENKIQELGTINYKVNKFAQIYINENSD